MRKSIIILAVVFLLATTFGCAQEKAKDVKAVSGQEDKASTSLVWLEDYDLALQKAETEDKVILINFTGSDWCKWCIKLVDEVFSKQEFADYANKNLVMLKLDFPRAYMQLNEVERLSYPNYDLLGKYQIQGFPTILLTDAQGKVIGQTGYQVGGPQKYIEHLEKMINR